MMNLSYQQCHENAEFSYHAKSPFEEDLDLSRTGGLAHSSVATEVHDRIGHAEELLGDMNAVELRANSIE